MRTLLSAGITTALLLVSSHAENLLENGSFELPKVSGRTSIKKGGNPAAPEEKTLWTTLTIPAGGAGGQMTAGLTDEFAHEGKQSLFIDFEKLTTPAQRAVLTSELLPVQANQPYRISVWGRLDRKRPLSLDERRPHILVAVEFFAADEETQLGNTVYRTQLIPGSFVPGLGPRILFVADKWNEYHTEIKSPTDSAFMKVVFSFEVPKEKGETDGLLFLDSAAIEGPRGSAVLGDYQKKESEEEKPEEGDPEPQSSDKPE